MPTETPINWIKVFWSVGCQVRELEAELEAEQRRHADAQKTIRRHERRIQEMTQLNEDEEKARDAERETMEKLQSKMKQYKRELDDAVSDWAQRHNQYFFFFFPHNNLFMAQQLSLIHIWRCRRRG